MKMLTLLLLVAMFAAACGDDLDWKGTGVQHGECDDDDTEDDDDDTCEEQEDDDTCDDDDDDTERMDSDDWQ